MMSESAPAGRASRNIGSVVAVCTSATMTGDGESEVISHPAPMSCIQVPMFEASVAIHSIRNIGIFSGDQAEAAVGVDVVLASVISAR